jgi:hypothetical protein
VAAVGKGREEGRVFGVHPVAEARQIQFADDALLQEAGEIRGGGDTVAGQTSSVTEQPPSSSRRSRTRTLRPARER